ncbi:hypothetical protein LSH36_228g04010 [Paralvinella palmiformis]|uniref:Band 7 domain-containing protein n=1 Tax=Paralvinella palmiformis TaxID=53620 RepID=A0AAD9JMN0_9ANNE|nr:hypothetical protein LSH36_228g04010 [Paralvinella palmiformis]
MVSCIWPLSGHLWPKISSGSDDGCSCCLLVSSSILIILTLPVSFMACLKEWDTSTKVDLRTVTFDVPEQELGDLWEPFLFVRFEHLDEATDQWGVKMERLEIKDVRLSAQLQIAMAAEAEATRDTMANSIYRQVIVDEREHKASRALQDAADIVGKTPCALQLRYLQTLNTISAEKNSTIIFPLPIELMMVYMK